jgi:hypothetical protein
MSAPVILARPHGEGAVLQPQSYLGREAFGAYRDAVVRLGGRYVPSLRANVITIERLPALREALLQAGLELAVDPELGNALQRAAADAQATAEAGARRLAEAESRLRDRGLTLYPYQRDGVRWLACRRAGLLADSMGLGKTVQVLMALPERAQALVVAPAAISANWLTECRRWRPDLKPGSIGSRADWRWPAPGELLVATYGALPAEDQEITQPPPGIYLVADEAHLLKGARGRRQPDGTYRGGVQRVRRWFGVQQAVQQAGGSTWLLTGTPLINRPQELWRVLQAAGLAEEAFGSYPRFVELAGGRKTRYGMTWDGEVSAEVPLALQRVSLRRDRETVLPDLPRKVRQVHEVPIADEDTIRLCDALQGRLEEQGYTVEDLADMSRLAQEVREVVFELLSRVRAGLATAKIPALLELIESYEEECTPVVVFSAHLAPLQALASRPGWGLIDGSVPADQRAATVEAFQRGDLRGVACSYAAGGVGITLTRAHHVVCVDLPWTPALLQQAEDRCCRIGQEADSVHVRILAADHPVDERVAELIVEKTRLIEQAVDASAVEQPPSVDEQIAQQAQQLADLAEETTEIAVRAVEDAASREQQRRAAREARARGDFTAPVPTVGKFRPPQSEEERRAAQALVVLAALDPDHARERNDVGFSAYDGEIGHSLANALVEYGRLSDRQWAVAVRLLKKYRRQVELT